MGKGTALIIGATGLCGHEVLKQASGKFDRVYSISRRLPEGDFSSDEYHLIIEQDSAKWTERIREIQLDKDGGNVLISGLGTTRAQAGGIANQRLIDLDLNLAVAEAARAHGFDKYVLVSSAGANAHSKLPYLKMKGELDEAVQKLRFRAVGILRPGALLGEREKSKGLGNAVFSTLGGALHGTWFGKRTLNPIYGYEVAAAALKLAKEDFSGTKILTGWEVNELGTGTGTL